jgi:hypothetical protein
VVAVVVSGVGVGLGGIKFRNSGSDGKLLVWCPSLLHSTHGGGMRGGRGAVGSFFVLRPPVVAGGVGSIGVSGVGSIGAMGVLGVKNWNCHGKSCLWARDHLRWM